MKHKLNRMTALLLAVIMAFSMLLVPVEAAAFTDVSAKAWYKSAVDFVSERGLMAGVSETRFAPETNMTRAMFVTVLARVAGVTVKNDTTVFSDVRTNKWYTGAVTWAAQQGLVSGVGDRRFAPNAEITRQDLCTILYKFLNMEDVDLELGTGKTFADAARVASYAKNAVNYCSQAGLISGYEDGTFRPSKTATRAEVAAILKKLYSLSGGIAPRPARTLESEGDDTMVIKVNAPEGALPDNADLTVSRITDEANLTALKDKVGGSVYAAADISFTRNGKELEPKTKVEVEIALDGLESIENPAIVHVCDDGNVEYLNSELVTSSRSGSTKALRFRADSFSVYVVTDDAGSEAKDLTVKFYARKKVDGMAQAGPTAAGSDQWELINVQKILMSNDKDRLYDPGVPTMSDSQIFDGWATKMNFVDGETKAVTVGDLNKAITDGEYAENTTIELYAMVYEVARAYFFDQNDQLIAVAAGHKFFEDNKAKVNVTFNQVVVPLVEGMEFLGWVQRKDASNRGARPEYTTNCPVYKVGTTMTFEVTNDRLEFYPYVKMGYWLTFESNVEQNNVLNGFDDPTTATNAMPIFVPIDETPAEALAKETDWAPPTRAGYKLGENCWYKDPECRSLADMNHPLSANTTFYARWQTDKAKYIVTVFVQSADDVDYTLWDVYFNDDVYEVEHEATTGSTITPSSVKLKNGTKNITQLGDDLKNPLGYYFMYDADRSQQSVRVQGNGQTTLNVYYTRRVVTFQYFAFDTTLAQQPQNRMKSGGGLKQFYNTHTQQNDVGYYKYNGYVYELNRDATVVLWSSDPEYLKDEYEYIPSSCAEFHFNPKFADEKAALTDSDHGYGYVITDLVASISGPYGSRIPADQAPRAASYTIKTGSNTYTPAGCWVTIDALSGVGSISTDSLSTGRLIPVTPYDDGTNVQTIQNYVPRLGAAMSDQLIKRYRETLRPYNMTKAGETAAEPNLSDDELKVFSNYEERVNDYTIIGGMTNKSGGAGNRSIITGNEYEGFRIKYYYGNVRVESSDYTAGPVLYDHYVWYSGRIREDAVPIDKPVTDGYDYDTNSGSPSGMMPMFVTAPAVDAVPQDYDYAPMKAIRVKDGTDLWLFYRRAQFTIKFFSSTDDSAAPIVSRTLFYERDLNNLLDETRDPYAASLLTDPEGGPTGCFFDGWYTDKGFQNEFSFDQSMPAHDLDVYAKWTPIDYRVILDYTGGDEDADLFFPKGREEDATFVVSYGEKLGAHRLQEVTRDTPDGASYVYSFAGWYLDPEFQHRYNINMKASDDMVFEENDLYYGSRFVYEEGKEPMDDYLARMESDARTGTDPLHPERSYDDRWQTKTENRKIRRVIRLYACWVKSDPNGAGVRVEYWGNHDLENDQGAFDSTMQDDDPTTRSHHWRDPDTYAFNSMAQGQAASVAVTPKTEDDPSRRYLYWEFVTGTQEKEFKTIPDKELVYPGQRFEILMDDAVKETKQNNDPYPYCKHTGTKTYYKNGISATCTTSGYEPFYECDICKRKYADEECKTPAVLIPALGHDWSATYSWSVSNGVVWGADDPLPTCTGVATCRRCEDTANGTATVKATTTREPTISEVGAGKFTVTSFNHPAFVPADAGEVTYVIPKLTKVTLTYNYTSSNAVSDVVDAGDVTLRAANTIPGTVSIPAGYELVGWTMGTSLSSDYGTQPAYSGENYTAAGEVCHVTTDATFYAVYRAKITDRGYKYVPANGTVTSGTIAITYENSNTNLVALRSLYVEGDYSDTTLGGARPRASAGIYVGANYISNVGVGFSFEVTGGKLKGAGDKYLNTNSGLKMDGTGATWTIGATSVTSGSSQIAYDTTNRCFTTASSASKIYVWQKTNERDEQYHFTFSPTDAVTQFSVLCNVITVGTTDYGSGVTLPNGNPLDGKEFIGWVRTECTETATEPSEILYAGELVFSAASLLALYRYSVNSYNLLTAAPASGWVGGTYAISSGNTIPTYFLKGTSSTSMTQATADYVNFSGANLPVDYQFQFVSSGSNYKIQSKLSNGAYLRGGSGTPYFYNSTAPYSDWTVTFSNGVAKILNTGTDKAQYRGLYFYNNMYPNLGYEASASAYLWKLESGMRYQTDESWEAILRISAPALSASAPAQETAANNEAVRVLNMAFTSKFGTSNSAVSTAEKTLLADQKIRFGAPAEKKGPADGSMGGNAELNKNLADAKMVNRVEAFLNSVAKNEPTRGAVKGPNHSYVLSNGLDSYQYYLIVVNHGGNLYPMSYTTFDGVKYPVVDMNNPLTSEHRRIVNDDGSVQEYDEIVGDLNGYLFYTEANNQGNGYYLRESFVNDPRFLMADGDDLVFKLSSQINEPLQQMYWNYDANACTLYNTRLSSQRNSLYFNFPMRYMNLHNANMASTVYLYRLADGTHTVTLIDGIPTDDYPEGRPLTTFTVHNKDHLTAETMDSLIAEGLMTASDKELFLNGPANVVTEGKIGTFARWYAYNNYADTTYLNHPIIDDLYMFADYEFTDVDGDGFGRWLPYDFATIDTSLDYMVCMIGDQDKGEPNMLLSAYNPYGACYGQGIEIMLSGYDYLLAYDATVQYDPNDEFSITGVEDTVEGSDTRTRWPEYVDWGEGNEYFIPDLDVGYLVQRVPTSPDYYIWNFSKSSGGVMTNPSLQARGGKFALEHYTAFNQEGQPYYLDYVALTPMDDPVSEWTYDPFHKSLSTNEKSLYLGFFVEKALCDFSGNEERETYIPVAISTGEKQHAGVELFVRDTDLYALKEKEADIDFYFNIFGDEVTEEMYTYRERAIIGQETALYPCRYEFDGARFVSWNTKPDGSGTSYTDQQIVKLKGNLKLYAQWEEVIDVTQRWIETDEIIPGEEYLIGVQVGDEVYLLVNRNEFSYSQPYFFYDYNQAAVYQYGYVSPAVIAVEDGKQIVTGVREFDTDVEGFYEKTAEDLFFCRWVFNGANGKYTINSASEKERVLTLGSDENIPGVFPALRGDYWKYDDHRLYVDFGGGDRECLTLTGDYGFEGSFGYYACAASNPSLNIKLFHRDMDSSDIYWSVRFVNEKGITIRQTQWVQNGNVARLPDDPSKDDYWFAGWFYDGTDTLYGFDKNAQSDRVTKDIVLVSRFVPKVETNYVVNLRAVYGPMDYSHTRIRWFGNNDPTGKTGGDLYLSVKDSETLFELDEVTGVPVPNPNYNRGLTADSTHPIYDLVNESYLIDGDSSHIKLDDLISDLTEDQRKDFADGLKDKLTPEQLGDILTGLSDEMIVEILTKVGKPEGWSDLQIANASSVELANYVSGLTDEKLSELVEELVALVPNGMIDLMEDELTDELAGKNNDELESLLLTLSDEELFDLVVSIGNPKGWTVADISEVNGDDIEQLLDVLTDAQRKKIVKPFVETIIDDFVSDMANELSEFYAGQGLVNGLGDEYEFLGWSIQEAGSSMIGPGYPNLNENDLVLRWVEGHFDESTNQYVPGYYEYNKNWEHPEEDPDWTTDFQGVASDSAMLTNAFYAVWQPKYYYVFHSATGVLERRKIEFTNDDGSKTSSTRTDETPLNKPVDLVSVVSPGTRYGGYYKTYGGVNTDYIQKTRSDTSGWVLPASYLTDEGLMAVIQELVANKDDVTVADLRSLTPKQRKQLVEALDNPCGWTEEQLNSITDAQLGTLLAAIGADEIATLDNYIQSLIEMNDLIVSDDVVAVWDTENGSQLSDLTPDFSAYDGYMKYTNKEGKTVAYWKKSEAYSIYDVEKPEEISDIYGETMRPKAGEVYYLKEVPEAYLASKLFFIYKNSENGDGSLEDVELKALSMVLVVDDNYYRHIGYVVGDDEEIVLPAENAQDELPEDFFEAILAKNYKIAKPNGQTTTIKVNTGSYEGLHENQGYVGVVVWNANTMGTEFYSTPMWETLDGVEVIAYEFQRHVDMEDPVETLSTRFTLELDEATVDGMQQNWLGDNYGTKVRIISKDQQEIRWLDVNKDNTVAVPDLGLIFKTMQIVRYNINDEQQFEGNNGNLQVADAMTTEFAIDYNRKTLTKIVGYTKNYNGDKQDPEWE